jgi:hypothetical protein
MSDGELVQELQEEVVNERVEEEDVLRLPENGRGRFAREEGANHPFGYKHAHDTTASHCLGSTENDDSTYRLICLKTGPHWGHCNRGSGATRTGVQLARGCNSHGGATRTVISCQSVCSKANPSM